MASNMEYISFNLDFSVMVYILKIFRGEYLFIRIHENSAKSINVSY